MDPISYAIVTSGLQQMFQCRKLEEIQVIVYKNRRIEWLVPEVMRWMREEFARRNNQTVRANIQYWYEMNVLGSTLSLRLITDSFI